MVSKAAVIAIVAILAVPILLGYALNFTETTETDYKAVGQSVNVTPILQNGTDYTYLNANAYELNTNFSMFNDGYYRFYPLYQSKSTQKTNLFLEQMITNPGAVPPNLTLSDFNQYVLTIFNNSGTNGVYMRVYDGDNLLTTFYQPKEIFYKDDTKTIMINAAVYTGNNLRWEFITIGNNQSYYMQSWDYKYTGVTNAWVDISGGFKINNPGSSDIKHIELPHYTKSYISTINLDSITESNYSFTYWDLVNTIYFRKTTVDGQVKWEYRAGGSTWADLYYDPSRTDNTYQIYTDTTYQGSTGNSDNYKTHVEIRYVGGWPSIIGEANAYKTYSYDTTIGMSRPNYGLYKVLVYSNTAAQPYTPTIRMDSALFRATEMPIIGDKTYTPVDFKQNPVTTISSISKYGSSLTFGGNNYTVSKGNINISGHDIPVDGLTLSSVPNELGTYDNKIGNTLVSTSAAPSTISFNGNWSASISTDSMESYTYTKTEWKAGDFAWDGMDHNFIMAGLLASLGAFIGVGIYARRTKSSVWPLLIVCGGAALLFFVML